MDELVKIFKGKKTYIVVILALVLAALEGLGIFTVPEWAWPALGAAGLGSVRLGVSSMSKEVEKLKDGSN